MGGIAQRAVSPTVRTVWWVEQHPPTDALAAWNDAATNAEEVLTVDLGDTGSSANVWLNDGTIVHVDGAIESDLVELHRAVEECTVVPVAAIGSTMCIAFVALRAPRIGLYMSVRVGSITVSS